VATAYTGADALGRDGRGAVAERLTGRWPILLGIALIVGALVAVFAGWEILNSLPHCPREKSWAPRPPRIAFVGATKSRPASVKGVVPFRLRSGNPGNVTAFST
jgi:hypothetical protein